MASAFGHACAAFGIGKVYSGKKQAISFWVLSVICAIIPDADTIGYKFGVPYDSTFGHRGFTHSIVFALLMGWLASWIFTKINSAKKDKWKMAFYFFVVTISHPLLDACTTGGLGVAFFSPFSNHRYFFPFHPIKVSPIAVNSFFSDWGLRVLLSEALWIGLPTLVVVLIASYIRKAKN